MSDQSSEQPQLSNESRSLPLAFSYRRVSSERQLSGDGMDRQLKSATEWCERNAHSLSTATFEDLGVSAYKGANAAVGALRAFLEAVEGGAVPQGSTLLVESLDRLSRQHWQRGLAILTDIVGSGVNLVTLFDGKMYRAGEPIDFADGIMILVGFQRAHEESATKSKRLTAAWKSNTEAVLAGARIRTSQCPSWLSVEGDLRSGVYKVIPDKAKIVSEVFSRFADGEGPSSIARDLEARGVPVFRRGHWRGQTVSQILRSEAPYGHLEIGRQLTPAEKGGTQLLSKGTYRKGDRVIIETVKRVMPRVVDAEIERRVRLRLNSREADVKPTSPVKPPLRKTNAMLTGVLKGNHGENLKRKKYTRTAAYVSPITNKYEGAVSHIDEVLVDWWPDIRSASMVDTNQETEALEAQLMEARSTLEFLQSRPTTRPRLLLAAEAEVEELEREIEQIVERNGLVPIQLPRDISNMEPHEVNLLVRSVISSVRARKSVREVTEVQEISRSNGTVYERRTKRPTYDLDVTMRNGIKLVLGEGAAGLIKLDD